MAKGGGKLTKQLMKTVLKKWQSFGKLSRSNMTSTNHHSSESDIENIDEYSNQMQMQEVYVGKCRRRYLIRSEVIEHPLFRELVDRSSSSSSSASSLDDDQSNTSVLVVVGCEVVMFEHLLWMLQNATDHSLDDQLVDFYSSDPLIN